MPRPPLRRALLATLVTAPAWPLARARSERDPASASAASAASTPLTVFAAVSLNEALRELAAMWAAQGQPAPRLSLAASSALARQIAQGAAADLFLSADEPWMDHLQQRGLLVESSRVSPIGNRLVLVAPAGRGQPADLRPGIDLAARLGPGGRLAVGDPAHVPAGRYAQAALQWLGQWHALAPRLARAENVRAALLLVERGEAPLGIVYATDAAATRGVQVLGSFPPGSHEPITYPMAVTRRAQDNPQARALHAFFSGAAAQPVWRRHGFSLLG